MVEFMHDVSFKPLKFNRNYSIRSSDWSLLGLLFLMSAPAFAQGSSIPSAEQFVVSPGGVDMRTGRYAIKQTDLSIGEDSETGGLTLTRLSTSSIFGHTDPFGNMSHNWDIVVVEKLINISNNDYSSGAGPDTRVEVHYGGRSETFDRKHPNADFEQISKAGRAQLTFLGILGSASAKYVMIAEDGTKIVFRPIGAGDCMSTTSPHRCAFVESIQFTNGTRFAFTYETVAAGSANKARLRRVESSRGFALLLEYGTGVQWHHVTKACVLNMATNVPPVSNDCPTDLSALATANYSYATYSSPNTNIASGYRLASATDGGGGAYSYTYTAAGTNTEMRFFKPSIASPWLTNTLGGTWNPNFGGLEEIVLSQIYADGQQYTYYYDDVPASDGSISGGIAGGRYTDNSGKTTTVTFGLFPMPGAPQAGSPPACQEERVGGYRTEYFFNPPPSPPSPSSPGDQNSPILGPIFLASREVPVGGVLFVGAGCLFTVGRPDFGAGVYFPELEFGSVNYQVTPGPIEVVDPLNRKWKAHYCDPNSEAGLPPSERNRCLVTTLAWTEEPDGKRTNYVIPWSTRNVMKTTQKAKAGSGLPDIVTSATYDCTTPLLCAKPLTVTDANNNVTTYTYDPVHGGLLSETGPAVNGIAPQKRLSYISRKGWVKNPAGAGFIQIPGDHWLLAREEYCKTSAAVGNDCAGGATDEVITEYEYGPDSGPNNLLLRGIVVTATGSTGAIESLRTCYGYNAMGRRISETQPAANLATCP